MAGGTLDDSLRLVCHQPRASAEIFPGEGQSRHFAYLFQFVAMQRKWTYTKNVQCYGNSYIQCFPIRKLYMEKMFVLLRIDISRLSQQSSK